MVQSNTKKAMDFMAMLQWTDTVRAAAGLMPTVPRLFLQIAMIVCIFSNFLFLVPAL